MSFEKNWSLFFKPEIRNKGQLLFEEAAVLLQTRADTQIQALIKGTSRYKVQFKSDSISSPTFDAQCSCSTASKGKPCAHIWATLCEVEKNHPDFLDSKKEIIINTIPKIKSPPNQFHIEQKEKVKNQQAEYRKQQYKRQKEQQKEKLIQKTKKQKEIPPTYPEEIKNALSFFNQNGFSFSNPIQISEVTSAWKLLSKVFHPDKGGTHAEVLLLNKNYEVLISWLED